jgi:hypothetical protein
MFKVKVSDEFCIKLIKFQRIKNKDLMFVFQLNWNQWRFNWKNKFEKFSLWVISILKLKLASVVSSSR